ncbi:hypothetical protein C4D60_Mb02t03290 [Musa balbisiana]|uniref:Uncharacterized protein n=1 Tax=Musa balbisiana TaxID=52838 RepID=A0A4S8I864_MUSBA|nr:hypothetical protein C4D60_Mb02t03290 [Musa balbisiana]
MSCSVRSESCSRPASKACREKMRREKLNDRLYIFALGAEKNELHDEKQKLKAEKESLEQRVKLLNARPSYLPHPPLAPSLFPTQSQAAAGHKLMVPIMGFHMWQFMAPTDVDTLQDADKCPPVA